MLDEIRHAARNLRRNANRTLVAVATVAAGLVAFLLASGFIEFIFHDMREATIKSQLGHLQIVRPGYFEKGIADPYAYLLPGEPAVMEGVRQVENVAGVTPRLGFNGLISLGEVTIPYIGEGVDPVGEKPISQRIAIANGRDLADASAREVILGEGLAKALGAKVGDDVVLLATAANGSAGAIEVKVVGVFVTIYKEYDDQALRLPIVHARRLMRVDGATSWVVLLDRTEHTVRAAAGIGKRLKPAEYSIVPWSQLADFYNKTVDLFSKQIDVMKVIIGLIIILTISNTQMMNVFERTTEIGTCLAIGRRQSTIMRMFIIEGVMIGALGGLIGVSTGFALAQLISVIGIPMPPPPGMAHGYVASILVTPALVVESFVIAFSTTLLASLMPAWRASRLNIVDALRTNQ